MVAEIWGAVSPHSEICAIFGVGVNVSRNKFVRSGPYALATLIDTREDPSTGFCQLGLVSLALVVVEIWGEVSPHSIICAFLGVGGGRTWNKFLRSGGMVL